MTKKKIVPSKSVKKIINTRNDEKKRLSAESQRKNDCALTSICLLFTLFQNWLRQAMALVSVFIYSNLGAQCRVTAYRCFVKMDKY